MENTSEILIGIRETLVDKKKLINEIRKYHLTQTEVIELEMNKYNEYIEGLLIKDITSQEQLGLGMTILHILSDKEIEFSLHMHNNQSQTINVVSGKILDLETNVLFEKGESFFVPKSHLHRLRYFKNTELLVIYVPSLAQIK